MDDGVDTPLLHKLESHLSLHTQANEFKFAQEGCVDFSVLQEYSTALR